MDALKIKREDSRFITGLRSIDGNSVNLVQFLMGVVDYLLFMDMHGVQADALKVICRMTEADGFGDGWRPRFKPGGHIRVGRALSRCTARIIDPPPRKGGMSSKSSRFP